MTKFFLKSYEGRICFLKSTSESGFGPKRKLAFPVIICTVVIIITVIICTVKCRLMFDVCMYTCGTWKLSCDIIAVFTRVLIICDCFKYCCITFVTLTEYKNF